MDQKKKVKIIWHQKHRHWAHVTRSIWSSSKPRSVNTFLQRRFMCNITGRWRQGGLESKNYHKPYSINWGYAENLRHIWTHSLCTHAYTPTVLRERGDGGRQGGPGSWFTVRPETVSKCQIKFLSSVDQLEQVLLPVSCQIGGVVKAVRADLWFGWWTLIYL